MLFSLPTRLGGFGLGDAVLNKELKVYRGTGPAGGRSYSRRYPDIQLVATGTDGAEHTVHLEYDPDSTHAGPRRRADDSARRNELGTQRGVSHLEVTDVMAGDFIAMSRTAEQARIMLMRRKLPRLRGSRDLPANQELLRATWTRQKELWRRLFVEGEPQGRAKERPVAYGE